MDSETIALTIPFLLLLVAIEFAATQIVRRPVYRLSGLFSNLGCGITEQVVGLLYGATILGSYARVYEHARIVQIENAWLAWTIAVVGGDFIFYWAHRASHRLNLLWTAHVVHHQSEDMNFAVALRQPLTDILVFPLYVPLAFILPAPVLAAAAAINTIYQFWIHSDVIPRLGPIEWVMNTPSHHRVHHGINPQYIDKNYGGIFIVWDRLFGTFEEERERAVYGTLVPIKSFDPIWAPVQPWVHLVSTAYRAPRWADKLRVWFMPPEWSPEGLPPQVLADRSIVETRIKREVEARSSVKVCLVVQLVLAAVATFLLLLRQAQLPAREVALAAAAILVTLLASGALLEGRRWARWAEVGWLAALALGAAPFVEPVLERAL
jgi:sterol desaturase/sphingolipid hydroxylase (fatty acid hydroxylase superfamily)